jgi:hypothetical protein
MSVEYKNRDAKHLYLKYNHISKGNHDTSLDIFSKKKYLKYKKKYLNLKKQYGGEITCENLNIYGLGNRYGTCWNVAILTIFLYGHETRAIVQDKFKNYTAQQLVDAAKERLELFLPTELLDENNELKPDKYHLLIELINEFKNRYAIKLDEDEFLYPSQTVVPDEEDSKHEVDPVPSSKPELFREKSQLCEIAFAKKFFKLFNIDKEEGEFGGDIKNDFFLCNLLGIIFLGHYINFDYIELNEDKLINEELIKNNIGILNISTNHVDGHMTGFFKCDETTDKYVDNNSIINKSNPMKFNDGFEYTEIVEVERN